MAKDKEKKQPGDVGYNGERPRETALKHHFDDTPVRQAIGKLRRGETLNEVENNLLLSTTETAEVLSILRRRVEDKDVSPRYLPQLVRDNRLHPAAPGSGRSYLYRMADIQRVRFGKAGVLKPRKKTNA